MSSCSELFQLSVCDAGLELENDCGINQYLVAQQKLMLQRLLTDVVDCHVGLYLYVLARGIFGLELGRFVTCKVTNCMSQSRLDSRPTSSSAVICRSNRICARFYAPQPGPKERWA